MIVLVVDIGGSHTKLALAESDMGTRFDSTPEMNPSALLRQLEGHTVGWQYDVVSIGYPGRVGANGPTVEPGNLGDGWVGFDFAAALGKPVRIVNDAVLQALGAYVRGRMLFLGFGTGIGSALVTEHVAVPLELGELPYRGGSLVDSLGRKGLARLGEQEWRQRVFEVVPAMRGAFLADDVVLGGGHAELLKPAPPGTRRGGNADAIQGGARLWHELVEPHDRQPSTAWRVVT
jgi:polyphosphate glucokinase